MRVKERKCICGHMKKWHIDFGSHLTWDRYCCAECCSPKADVNRMNIIHEFKLDNLKLIEDTAKHRGLI